MAPSEDVAVVDEELIQQALHEGQEGGAPLSVMVSEATLLRLSFKTIKSIANLSGFEKLTTLCLDNNVIDKIANIGHLVNLKWLDLSFNNISVIEGLENLTQLMDISLYNNKISEIQGLDACKDLQCLSIGNNDVKSLDICHYLRKFKKLHLVNLEGNPVCDETEYKMQLLAFLPSIKYMDYALIQPSDVANAREQYQDELQEAEENEAVEAEKAKRDVTAAELTTTLEKANLSVIQTIFDDFFKEDSEHHKLQHLPTINEHVDTLRNSIDQLSEGLKITGLQLQESKDLEITKFEDALNKLRGQAAATSVKLIEDFNMEKKRVLNTIEMDGAPPQNATPLLAKLDALYDKLMDLEMQQVQQFEELQDQFYEVYGNLKAQCGDLTTAYFKNLQEAEENYYSNVTGLANELLEKAGKEDLPEGLPEEAKNLLVDRDALLASISASHDVHVTKGFNAESQMEEKEKNRFKEIIDNYTEDSSKRNRSRIMEMFQFVKASKEEIENILEEDAVEEDEYDDL
ncbi:hypothetical protein TrVE_jg1212 [Triparma verrucosa]|uniref:Dynein regulatory complex subunit 3 n=1 Tax=Triparma verrucosa TaxID=1606542 RepID=A0A9W7FBN3_9STRA|nr:hypothetical protein TrVE_jg1212 [Triparma verrucosa]